MERPMQYLNRSMLQINEETMELPYSFPQPWIRRP